MRYLLVLFFSTLGLFAETHHFLPHFTSVEGLWRTQLTLGNMNETGVQISLTAYAEDGAPAGSRTLELGPGESYSGSVRELFANLNTDRGWLRMTSSHDNIVGQVSFMYLPTGGVSSLPPSTGVHTHLAMPSLEQTDDRQSGLALLNPNAFQARAHLKLVDMTGAQLHELDLILAPRTKRVAMLADLFDGTIPARSRLEVSSDQGLVGFGLIFQNNVNQIIAAPATAWQPDYPGKMEVQLKAIMQNRYGGASVAFQRGDGPIYATAAGYADVEGQKPMTTEHAGELGSITKVYTAALMLLLQEDGLLDLDQTIERWLPDFPRANEVTLRMLLNHTSGIPDYNNDTYFGAILSRTGDYVWTAEELISFAFAERNTYEFDPGTNASYSNTGYTILAMVAEKVSGRSFADLMRARIIEPLALKSTYMRGFEPTTIRTAHGYLWDADGDFGFPTAYTDMTDRVHGSVEFGDGGLVSTPSDVIRFARALFNGALLSAESLQEMTTSRSVGGGDYGLGLDIGSYDAQGNLVYGHDGGFIWGIANLIYLPYYDLILASTYNVLPLADGDVDGSLLQQLTLIILDTAIYGNPIGKN